MAARFVPLELHKHDSQLATVGLSSASVDGNRYRIGDARMHMQPTPATL